MYFYCICFEPEIKFFVFIILLLRDIHSLSVGTVFQLFCPFSLGSCKLTSYPKLLAIASEGRDPKYVRLPLAHFSLKSAFDSAPSTSAGKHADSLRQIILTRSRYSHEFYLQKYPKTYSDVLFSSNKHFLCKSQHSR